ncbi:hypothetical protein N657DRAFT_484784 [Parathielavia appendiculata]|uniref:Uncharacterized protein n=1 Tax=Parathielavia appendiculata TaxID=2587402 RepID=A0AAN6TY78_9PEZI|nr:hypothetical protein N657DRAFT_484784 [Parathielavia appendiculata]
MACHPVIGSARRRLYGMSTRLDLRLRTSPEAEKRNCGANLGRSYGESRRDEWFPCNRQRTLALFRFLSIPVRRLVAGPEPRQPVSDGRAAWPEPRPKVPESRLANWVFEDQRKCAVTGGMDWSEPAVRGLESTGSGSLETTAIAMKQIRVDTPVGRQWMACRELAQMGQRTIGRARIRAHGRIGQQEEKSTQNRRVRCDDGQRAGPMDVGSIAGRTTPDLFKRREGTAKGNRDSPRYQDRDI